jgi:hypothetical protein
VVKPGDPLDKQIPNYFNPQGLLGPPPPPPEAPNSPLWPGALPRPTDPRLTHNEIENIRQEIVQAQREEPTTGGLHMYKQPERLQEEYRKGGPVIHPTAKGIGLQGTPNFAHGGAVLNHERSPYMKV